MSPVLRVPFDIVVLIIDIVGENKDTNLLKELALVSHSFLQICRKHLFATVQLHDAIPNRHIASSKNGFIKLLKSRPDVVKYIRKLTYIVGDYSRAQLLPARPRPESDDYRLSPILPNLLRTIPRLNYLKISGSRLDWNTLDSSLTSAFLYLMDLPTVNHIDLSYIQDFPLSNFTPSVNLHRLEISYLMRFDRPEEYGSPEIIVQSEMMPKIREFRSSGSPLLTTKLLHAKKQDGRPAFNFMDLRRLSICLEDEQNIRYLLENAKLLERLHLSVEIYWNLEGLHDILSPIARTLKVLELTVPLCDDAFFLPLAGLCEELEAMAGHNMLEALSFEVEVGGYETEHFIGSIIQNVEKVLVKPGWSALRQVSFKVSMPCCAVSKERRVKLTEALQSLPDKYLSRLSKHDSVLLDYSVYVNECTM